MEEKRDRYADLTMEDVEEVIRKICSPIRRYGNGLVIGFYMGVPDKGVWLVNEEKKQNGKRIILMSANGTIHKAILAAEEKDDYKIERLSDCTMDELMQIGLCAFTDEEGNSTPHYVVKPFSDYIKELTFDDSQVMHPYNPFVF